MSCRRKNLTPTAVRFARTTRRQLRGLKKDAGRMRRLARGLRPIWK